MLIFYILFGTHELPDPGQWQVTSHGAAQAAIFSSIFAIAVFHSLFFPASQAPKTPSGWEKIASQLSYSLAANLARTRAERGSGRRGEGLGQLGRAEAWLGPVVGKTGIKKPGRSLSGRWW